MNWINNIKGRWIFGIYTILWFEIIYILMLFSLFKHGNNDMTAYVVNTFNPHVIFLFITPLFLFIIISNILLFQDEMSIVRFKNRTNYWNTHLIIIFSIAFFFSCTYLIFLLLNGFVYGLNFDVPLIHYLILFFMLLMGFIAIGLFLLVIKMIVKRNDISVMFVIAWLMSELFNYNPLHLFVWRPTVMEEKLIEWFVGSFIPLVGLCIILYIIGLKINKNISLINVNIKQEGGER